MKKFRAALLSLLILFFAPVLVACNEQVEQVYRVKIVEFTQGSLELWVGADPYQLEWRIEDNTALDQRVTFTSSRPEVATVSADGKVTPVAKGTTVISVKSEDNPNAITNNCTVRVWEQKQTLQTPQNLSYNSTNNELSWDKVSESKDGNLIYPLSSFVPKYELTLKTPTTEETKVISGVIYTDLEPGVNYTEISVKALGNDYFYNTSESSQKLAVHILDAPKNIKVSASAEYGSLNTGDLIVNDKAAGSETNNVHNSAKISSRNYTLSFEIPENGSQNVADYFVELTMINSRGVDANADIAEADSVFNEALGLAKIENGVFSMPIKNLPSGDYAIRACAKGDAQNHTYNSAYAQISKKMIVLSSPKNLVLSGEHKETLSWNSVSYASGYMVLIKYKRTYNDSEEPSYANVFVKSGNITSLDLTNLVDSEGNKFLENDYSEFKIYVYALGADVAPNSYVVVDSAQSEENARAQLSQVKNIRLSAERNSSQNLSVIWDAVTNAGTYYVEVYNKNRVVYQCNISENTLTINKDADWLSAGTFTIKIVAMPLNTENYVQSAISDGFDFVKLETPVVSSKNGVLTWSRIDGVNEDLSYTLHYIQNGTNNIEVRISNFENTYDFSKYVYDEGNYTDFYVVAKGDETPSITNVVLDSNPSNVYIINKLTLPNKFTVSAGELLLNHSYATNQSFASYLLKVYEEENPQILLFNTVLSAQDFAANSQTDCAFNRIVNSLEKNKVYVLSLTALKPTNTTQNENTLYVKSEEVLTKVYISPDVENIKAKNGVVSWNIPQKLYELVAQNNNGKIVLDETKLTNIKYLVKNSATNTMQYVPAVVNDELTQTASITFANILGGTKFNVSVQVVMSNAENAGLCILNSGFVSADFEKIGDVVISNLNTSGDEPKLLWQLNGLNDVEYHFNVKHMDANGDVHDDDVVINETQIDTSTLGYNAVLLSELISYEIDEGIYTITAKAYPTQSNTSNYVISNESAAFTFRKLDKPTIIVEDDEIIWQNEVSSSNFTYDLMINDTLITNIADSTYSLDGYSGVINVKVKTNSTQNNILSSEFSDVVKIVKLNSAQVNVRSVLENSVIWEFPATVNLNSVDVDLDVKKFAFKVYRDTNLSTVLESGVLEVNADNKFAYEMPQNSRFASGAYTVQIVPLGSSVTNELDGVIGFMDGDAFNLHIYKMPQVSELKIENENLIFDEVSASIGAVQTKYVIKISALGQYFYVATPYDGTEIQAVDNDGLSYVYNVPSNLNSLIIPLQKSVYVSNGTEIIEDDGGIIQNLLNTETSNYVPSGSSFSLKINTNPATRTIVSDGVTYYVFDSNAATIKNITLLDAPDVRFMNGEMRWTVTNSNFTKLRFEFNSYTWDGTYAVSTGKTLVPTGNEPIVEEKQGYTIRNFNLSNLYQNKFDTSTYYSLTVQSLGNGATTISSKSITPAYIISNIAPIKINTSATEATADGWYVKDGAITWKALDGVKEYVIKFEQLRENSDSIITNSQEITYPESNASTYSYVPDSGLYLSGSYLVSLKAVGDVYDSSQPKYASHLFDLNGRPMAAVFTSSDYLTKVASTDPLADNTNAGKLKLRQLDVNSTLTVKNGELVWENKQANVNTGYKLKFVDYDTSNTVSTVSVANTEEQNMMFVFSNTTRETATYYANLCTLGSTWLGLNGTVPELGVWLTSKDSADFRFRYINRNDILPRVTNGVFEWSLNVNGTQDWGATFSVGASNATDGDLLWLKKQATFFNNLENLDVNESYEDPTSAHIDATQTIEKIAVRVIGTETAVSTQVPLLNSASTLELRKLKKLPDIANFTGFDQQIVINEIGDLVWNCGYTDSAYAGFSTNLGVMVFNGRTGKPNNNGKEEVRSLGVLPVNQPVTFNYESVEDLQDVSPIYQFNINVVGSTEYNGGSLITYLSSNKASIRANRFGSVSRFTTLDGINLVWNAQNACILKYDSLTDSINKILPTKYIVEYIESSYYDFNNDKPYNTYNFSRIVFDALNEDSVIINSLAQFLNNGAYVLKISAYKDQNTLRSSPVYCMIDGEKDISFGGKFDGLVYDSDGSSHFIISSERALKNVRFVLDSNVLYQNTLTPTTSILGTDQVVNNYTISKGANYRMNDDVELESLENQDEFSDNLHNSEFDLFEEELMLVGTFDGNGHTISNIQVLNSPKLAWFDTINYTAEIKDLTLSYHSIDIDFLGWNVNEEGEIVMPQTKTYFGFMANTNNGVIKHCSIISDVEYPISQSYFDNTNNIVLGIFAGKNEATILSPTNTVRAEISNCVNGLNMPRNAKLNVNNPDVPDHMVIVSGIVGVNDCSDVINCSNGVKGSATLRGNLIAYQTGGIAYRNQNNGLIKGCENFGNLLVWATQNDGQAATGGGIAAFNGYGQIVSCVNHGNIEGYTSEVDQSYNRVNIGGIVGSVFMEDNQKSIITNCLQTFSEPAVGLHIFNNGIQGEVSWLEHNVGYIIGSYQGSGTNVIENCAYKETIIPQQPGESTQDYNARVEAEKQYYAQYACGMGDSYLTVVPTNDEARALAAVNAISEDAEPYLTSFEGKLSIFVLNNNEIQLERINENTEFDKLQKEDIIQTATVATNPGFVVKLNDDTEFNLTTISIKTIYYEITVGETIQLTETKPTQAGTYKVFVYYTLDSSYAGVNSDVVFEYTYQLTA